MEANGENAHEDQILFFLTKTTQDFYIYSQLVSHEIIANPLNWEAGAVNNLQLCLRNDLHIY